jgi:TATA-box binding protein (TBP) (component of TFIID and TFIIIB)
MPAAASSSSTDLKISPLRISTMTVIGHLGAIPNLQRLYDAGNMVPYWWIGEGILKIEYAGQRKGVCSEDILHTSTKEKKRFFNQSSLVFRLALPLTSEASQRFKETNIKLFKNGGFQMTGISSEAMARAALTRLIEMNRDRGIWATDGPEPHIQRFDTCMINSDYSIDKAIRRDRLYRTLVEDCGLWSTYEPTIYQGVNTKFFWNKARPAGTPPGICVCPVPCEGDGSGYAVGQCKKITIAPFRTGKIIITGAKHLEQLEDAYQFMNDVFRTHSNHVLRDVMEGGELVAAPPTPKKKAVVKMDTAEAILRQKMRASPRNVVRLLAAAASVTAAAASVTAAAASVTVASAATAVTA